MNKQDKRIIVEFIQTYASLDSEIDTQKYNELVRIQQKLCKDIGLEYKYPLTEVQENEI
jgi:hypothetical protein